MKTRVTVETVTEDLDRIMRGAESDAQWAAAKGAAETKAKLHGLLVDRKETGAPGDFAQLESVDAIVAELKRQYGDDAAAMLLTMLANQTPKPELEPSERPDDEALN